MTVDQAIEKSQSPYLAAFARAEIELAGSGPRRLEEIRREAIDRFADLGFPTTRDEEWKFTNLGPLTSITFDRAGRAYDKHDVDALIRRLPETPNRLVFVNGYYAPELSSWRNKGIKLLSFQKAFEQQNAKFEQLLCRYADFRQHAFIALNTAFLADGAFVQIPAGAIIEEPILLLHISAGGAKPVVSYPRNLIVLGEHSQASIVETYIGLDGNSSLQPYFANAVTEIVEGEEAILDHYKLQMEAGNAFHIATIQAQVGRGGVFRSYAFNLGAALARTEINSVLEEGSDCTLNGLYERAAHSTWIRERLSTMHSRTLQAMSCTKAFSMITRAPSLAAGSLCAKTHRKPTRNRPIRISCSRKAPPSTPNQSCVSLPTMSAARTVRPWASLMRKRCFICAPAASSCSRLALS